MDSQTNQPNKIVDVCLLAGKIMLQSGAETYRVEDTMMRIAASYGAAHSHSFVTPTGIIFTIEGIEPTKLFRISERSTDLKKVSIVNSISRRISEGEIPLEAAYVMLKQVDTSNYAYPLFIQIGAASLASGCFLIMFLGGWSDFLPALLVGGIGYSSLLYLHHLVNIKFFAEFFSSFLIGILAMLFVSLGIGTELDKIIIGSVMPLVPGLLITNAVRDLMAGHLVSGISKGADAFLTSFAIGTGIAVVFSFLQ